MRLHVLLPKVKADQITPPTHCVDPKCQGRKFRVYPQGGTLAQTSLRVKGLAVML